MLLIICYMNLFTVSCIAGQLPCDSHLTELNNVLFKEQTSSRPWACVRPSELACLRACVLFRVACILINWARTVNNIASLLINAPVIMYTAVVYRYK